MLPNEDIRDEDMIERLRAGEEAMMDIILNKYKKTVRNKAKALYLMGGDEDDLIQEGMIGLFKAVVDYRFDKDASFATFANTCISRQMYNAIQMALRKKHQPLNSYISISEGDVDKEEIGANPENMVIDRENEHIIRDRVSSLLSALENRVLELMLEGHDYKEIARIMDKTPKTIDNAIQRIKSKLKKAKAYR